MHQKAMQGARKYPKNGRKYSRNENKLAAKVFFNRL